MRFVRGLVACAMALLACGMPADARGAAPSPYDALARAHIAAEANGDLAALHAQYRKDASLWWVGGPLDGLFEGSDEIDATWKKFAALGVKNASVEGIQITGNAQGTTVVVDVLFLKDQMPFRVREVLLYRDTLLWDEIWQNVPPDLSGLR
jgi:hypothetical protein